MTVLAHPTLLSRPTLADAVAKRAGGEWEIVRGLYCRLRPRATVSPLRRIWPYIFPTDPNGPEAA